MTRTVTVLGATGSIGRQTLEVIAAHPRDFSVVALAGGRNADLLAQQAHIFKPKFVAIADERAYKQLKDQVPSAKVEAGAEAVIEAARMNAGITMAAIVGTAGLKPTMAAIERGKTVAFASKECLVAAGQLMMDAVKKHGTTFLPVDSEHNAIFQVLQPGVAVRRIVLTASGGPFREWSAERIAAATPEQAVAHPTWSMGPKISVDSATLMNKALEVIEAHHLFGLPSDQIDVVLHPQSAVHGMVEYEDGSFLTQMGPSDMRTPIAVCMGWPERIATPGKRMDLNALARLDFAPIDTARFPAMKLVRDVLAAGPAQSITFNAANEIAVGAFLNRQIGFNEIVNTVRHMLEGCHNAAMNSLDDVATYDDNVRSQTLQILKKAA